MINTVNSSNHNVPLSSFMTTQMAAASTMVTHATTTQRG